MATGGGGEGQTKRGARARVAGAPRSRQDRPLRHPHSLPPTPQAYAVPSSLPAKEAAALNATGALITKVDTAKANLTSSLYNKVNLTALLAKVEAAANNPNATLPLTLSAKAAAWNATKVMGTGKMIG